MKISVRREGSVDALVGRVHREADIGFVWKRRILWEIIQTGKRPIDGWDRITG
jgi:hypothetical protein